MLEITESSKQTSKLQKAFEKALLKEEHIIVQANTGHQGGGIGADSMYYFPRLDFWFKFFEHDNRFWNGFGLGDPRLFKNNDIVCEINFPTQGLNRRVAGAFAIDGQKHLVLHRGKIGGGKGGVGKSLFEKTYIGKWEPVLDGGQQTELAIVGDLNSPNFPKQVLTFIQEVRRVKDLPSKPASEFFALATLSEHSFSEEFSGPKRQYNIDHSIHPQANHGLVIKALADEFEKLGVTVANTGFVDLYIHKSGKVKAIFEAKTSLKTTDIYSAIGQLLYHGTRYDTDTKKILVVPVGLAVEAANIVQHKLGLSILYYEWHGDSVSFLNLEHLL